MKRIYYSLIAAIVLLAAGCQKGPYPYISKDEAKKLDSIANPAIKNVAFIYKGNIYYAADLDKPVTQITTDGSAAKFVKMSHDHSKFAYLNASNRIAVVDNKGNNIIVLSQYSQVKSFDWSADDKTLYILNGNGMVYYGPGMNLPAITYPNIPNGSTEDVLSASVSMNGDFAYVLHWFDFYYGDRYEMVIQPANNGQLIVYKDPEEAGVTMDYVNFSANKQDLVLGYKHAYSNTDLQESVEVFTDLNPYPSFSYTGACTPMYNSDLNYIVGGFTDASVIAPAAIYLGGPSEHYGASVPENKLLTEYSISGSNMYTDWK